MSFVDCINSALADGKLTAARAAKATAAYHAQYTTAVNGGMSPGAAANSASFAAVSSLSAATAKTKWARIRMMQAQHKVYTALMAQTDVPGWMTDFSNKIDIAILRLRGDLFRPLAGFIEAHAPKYLGVVRPIKDLDDVVRVAHGGSASPEATGMAKAIADQAEYIRKRANVEGVMIKANPKRLFPRRHERSKIRAAGKTTWIGDHINTLDWTIVEYHGQLVDPADRLAVLGEVYDGIITEGQHRIKPGQPYGESFASRLETERFLYYKDADSEISMMKKYGGGNLFEQVVGYTESMARNIALMEHLGPNPPATREYMHRVADLRAGQLELARTGKKGRSVMSRVDGAKRLFDNRYAMQSMTVDNASEVAWAQGAQTVRTGVTTGLLANLWVASQADHFFMRFAAKRFKLPGMNLTTEYLHQFTPAALGGAGKAEHLEMLAAGVVVESDISQAHAASRWLGSMEGAKIAQRFSDISFRASMATPHLDAAKNTVGKGLLQLFAKFDQKAWDDLPLQPAFREFGITREDWDLLRAIPSYTPGFSTLFGDVPPMWKRPGDLRDSTVGNRLKNLRAADKFSDFMAYIDRYAVPQIGSREQVALGKHLPADSIPGQVMRTVGPLKSFPMLMYHTYWRDIARMQAPTTDKFKLAARFMVYMFGAGVFVTQLQSVIRGQGLYNPAEADAKGNAQFFTKVVTNAGILGPLGDIFASGMDTGNSKGRSLAETLAGPIPQFFSDTGELTIGNIYDKLANNKTSFNKDLTRWIQRYVPHYWYTKVLLEREFYDEWLLQTDPAAYTRKRRRMEENVQSTGREMWWPMQ